VFLAGLWASKLIPPLFQEMGAGVILLAFTLPLLFAALVGLWWLAFSRARWWERLAGLAALAIVGTATNLLADTSMRGTGMMFYALPWGVTAMVAALTVLRACRPAVRLAGMTVAVAAALGYWDTLRNDGIWGDFHANLNWRWVPSPEDEFLASRPSEEPIPPANEPLGAVLWPEFRGPDRDGDAPGVVLHADWEEHPPVRRWTVAVGPGWGSFSLAGTRLFTQEQRGENEAVICYDTATGRQRWSREYPGRFWESVGGAGPRGTPTIAGEKLYALGAKGTLVCLDPLDGTVIWQRELETDAGRQAPQWGFSASPLVADGLAIVHAGGAGDKGVLAYDAETGDPRWSVPSGDHSYSSPQRFEEDGRPLVLVLSNAGLTAIDPATGKVAWEFAAPYQGYRVVQPLRTEMGEWLVGTGIGGGTQSIRVTPSGDTFKIEESWSSGAMKPWFNDYVQHEGYLYGFDHTLFGCIDLSDGERMWKGGRYGAGQVLLLPDGDQLLVASETGELALLAATPDDLEELARFTLFEGKTWNHPILVGDRLYARNGEKAVCIQMPVVEGAGEATAERVEDDSREEAADEDGPAPEETPAEETSAEGASEEGTGADEP
jgi:outer membrane protein assembly factor BamB